MGLGFPLSRLRLVTMAVIALMAAPIAVTQEVTGNIYGRVVDEQVAPFPGVAVTLTGIGAPLAATTAESGEFRFLNLSPGEYKVTAAVAGFSTAERQGIIVGSRQNAEIEFTLKVAARVESVVVTGESPLLDTRKSNVGVNVPKLELEGVPTARDPWAILQSVPGVQMDRVNVAGSESGSQSYFVGKGTPPTQNAWTLDGVDVNQRAGAFGNGATAAYFDYDSFEEVQISTGGTDPSTQTAGVQVNLITKRGTNTIHGSARGLITDERWVATNTPEELRRQLAAGGANPASNTVNGMQDYSADLGGPILRDRLWLWGAYGRTHTDLIVAGGLFDNTTLENISLKANAQPFKNNTATLFYNRADKVKLGRDAGTTRPQETTWDQAGPNSTFKIEDSHVFSQSLFATVAAAYKDFGFTLTPEGSGQMRQDSDQVFHNTYFSAANIRPQAQVNGNLSYFFRTGDLGHQVKLGGRFLRGTGDDRNVFEGNVVACNATAGVGANWCGPQSVPAAVLNRDLLVLSYLYHYSGYVSDTITLPRLTVNLGLRYDDQHGVNAALSLPASAAASLVPPGTVLPPALDISATDPGFRWKNWQPRVGATYSPDSAKKTLVRASYARYANQLGAASITIYSPAPATSLSGGAGVVYAWRDANNDNHVDPGELDTSRILRSYGFDPTNPSKVSSSINGVDPGFGAVKTDEISVGLDHAFLPTLAVSLVGTYRRMSNFELATGFGLSQADYILSTTNYRENGRSTNPLCPQVGYACGALPDGTRYNVPVYRVNPSLTPSLSPGQYTRNNPGYHQTYYGLELQATKRYSDHWMARFSASYNDWKQHYGENGFVDPTNVELYDGGLAVVQSIGSGDKQRVYINGTWQVSLSAQYTLPRGFSIAGNFFARQGYPVAYFQNVTANPSTGVSYDRTKSVLVAPYDRYRLGAVSDLNLGLSRNFKVRALEVKLLVDVFNVMNRNTVLQRQSQVGVFGPNGTNSIREVMPPRVLRVGARLFF